MKKLNILLMVPTLAAVSIAAGLPSVGDTLKVRTWFDQFFTVTDAQMTHTGTITETEMPGDEQIDFLAMVQPDSISDDWRPIVPQEGIDLKISVYNHQPENITEASQKFSGCEWINGISSSFALIGDMKIYFPSLPQDQDYETGDFYKVTLSDTVAVTCTYDEIAGAFIGVFERTDEVVETGFVAVDPLLKITTNDDNPFRFGGIIANTVISPYTGTDLTCCGTGNYGLEITDYLPVALSATQPRSVQNLAPFPLEKADSVLFDLQGRKMARLPKSVKLAVTRRERILVGGWR